MKAVIKIIIALALVNAAVRAGFVASSYYQLKDDAEQAVTFGGRLPTAQLETRVLEKAAELGVPLERRNLDVRREKDVTYITAGYTQPVELFPTFVYPVELSFAVEARSLVGLR